MRPLRFLDARRGDPNCRYLSNTIVVATVVALPVGAAAFVSPMGGIFGLVSGLLFAYV